MGVKLHYRKLGTGAPLIILHGLYGSSDNWLSVAKKLEHRFTVYLPDLRNHGASPHTSSHTFEEMTDDLLLFLDSHHISQAILLGHSMGGKLAMMFAADYPERVSNLIVADIAPKNYFAGPQPAPNVLEHELILSLMDDLNLVAVTSRQDIDHYLAQKLSNSTLRQFLIKNIHRNKEGDFEWKINVKVLKHALGSITTGLTADWFDDRIPITNYPVTFIRGLKSDYISDQDIPLIRAIYPDAHLIDIPNAGHWLHAEQPELFLQALLSAI